MTGVTELIGKDEKGNPAREVIMDGSVFDVLNAVAREAKALCNLFDKQGCISATDLGALAASVIAFNKGNV